MYRMIEMGKSIHLKHMDDKLKDINPSCMWGLIHAVDYHRWRGTVKRMLPYKRNHARQTKGHQIPNYDFGEQKMLIHEKEKQLPVDQSAKKGGSTNKISIKARLKNLLAHRSTNEGNGKRLPTKYSSRSGLPQTNSSIHHLEAPSNDPADVYGNWEHRITFIPGKKEVGAAKLYDPVEKNATKQSETCDERFTKLKNKDGSKDEFEGFANVLEMLRVDNKIFPEILQNANHEIRKSSRLPHSKAKARLVKSGSFPGSDLSRKRGLKPSKFKHKQSEIWCTVNWEAFRDVNRILKDVSHDSRDLSTQSGLSSENIRGIKFGHTLSLGLETSRGSDYEEHGEEVQSSQERNQGVQFEVNGVSSLSALDEVSNEYYCSTIGKDTDERCGETVVNRDGGVKFSRSSKIDEDMLRKRVIFHRRGTSLNESVDKYAALFDNNFGNEGKLQSSRSLRLRNEDEIQSYKNTPRLFSRVRSLSIVDLYSSLQCEGNGEAIFVDWPIKSLEEIASYTFGASKVELNTKSFSEKTQEVIQPDDFHGSESEDTILEKGDHTYEMNDLAGSRSECRSTTEDLAEENTDPIVGEKNTCMEQIRGTTANSSDRLPQPCPTYACDSSFEDKVATVEDFQSLAGMENEYDNFDPESSINCKKSLDNFSLLFPGSIDDTANTKDPNSLGNLEMSTTHKEEDAELDFIRHILEFSGFSKDWKWHLSEQPLKPSLFDEACRPQEFERFTEDLRCFYHYQLLFDLVNEELAHFHVRSSTYYPKALSHCCRIRPIPVGNRILEEIYASISKFLTLNLEEKLSLDSVIDFELKKDESWMNLQWESESVALEVDHVIFDELLEELIC